ncbi:MAG: helix-turn-helix transcriptional regulator [Clostridia bacterium]|nr:helix-turn-helix transcriptional regulator [Clostridia bacterium]
MKRQTILEEIKAYLKYLTFTLKLDVSLCDFYYRIPIEFSDYLSEFMIHPNVYCQKMKAHCMKYCLWQQQLIRRYVKKNDRPFFGACYAGVSEYVFPVIEREKYYGFISVTSYRSQEEPPQIRAIEKSDIHETYKKTLRTDIPSEPYIKAILSPLVNSLKLLTYYIEPNELENAQHNHDYLYQTLLQYISENYFRPLTLETIAEELHYSASYLSHVFKERNKPSIMQYVKQLKIQKAKELLRNTEKSVIEISELLGFMDSNYFTAVFKKATGKSPRSFRNEQKRAAYPPVPPAQKPKRVPLSEKNKNAPTNDLHK